MVAQQNLPPRLPKEVTAEFVRLARSARRPAFVFNGSQSLRALPADQAGERHVESVRRLRGRGE